MVNIAMKKTNKNNNPPNKKRIPRQLPGDYYVGENEISYRPRLEMRAWILAT
jgi:hypothetical protein